MKRSKWWRLAGITLLAAVVAWAVYRLFFTRPGMHATHMGMHQVSEYLQSFGIAGMVAGALIVYVQIIVPFAPFIVVAGINIILYPSPWGFIVNYAMSCLGAITAFVFARYYGRHWVSERLNRSPLALQFNKQMERSGFLYVLLGRLIPVIPSSFINMGAGVTKIRFRPFLFATLLGKFPIVFLESQITNYLLHFKQYRGRLLLLLAIFAALIVIGYVFRKRLASKR